MPTSLPRLKDSDLTDLRTLRAQLHLLFHRNKNQHRRSAWWRSFAGFRRELGRLLEEVETLGVGNSGASTPVPSGAGTAGTGKVGGGKGGQGTVRLKGEQKKALEGKVAERIRVWVDVYVGKWWLSFTQLIASTQFSALGLMLLASLARVCHILGITAAYEELAAEEVREALRRFAEEDAGELFGDLNRAVGVDARVDEGGSEDLGVLVGRNGEVEDVCAAAKGDDVESKDREGTAVAEESIKGKTSTSREGETEKGIQVAKPAEASKAPPKKKRKKGNAIDELFSGLL